jgi:RNA polymerase sigma-70 factor, ECF subfamily
VTETPLEELMIAYIAGEATAFDQLYRRLSPNLFAYLLRLTKDRPRAEDLLQTTFTKLHRARTSYLDGAPVLPWVLAIARRSFLDERRAAKVRTEDLSDDGILPEPKRTDETASDDMAEAVDHALNRLPEAYREAIQLTKILGLSLVEAANVLDTTPTAVKLRVHRGYTMLREQLQRLHQPTA